MKNIKQWVVGAGLLAAIGYTATLLPWGAWGGVPFSEVAEARLTERVAEYKRLRASEDWAGLYDLVKPDHRKIVGKAQFLQLFGSGVVRYSSFETKAVAIDEDEHAAQVVMRIDGEMLPDRLPPAYRASLRIDDPAALKQTTDLTLDWSWQDGDWHFHLDRELLTGKDAQGRAIVPLSESSLPTGNG